VLGWKYVSAEEEAQKYKEGMFILETKRVLKGVDWDNHSPPAFAGTVTAVEDKAVPPVQQRKDSGVDMDEAVEFDSQDEDECEDLFMGIWTPGLARRRRRARDWDE
jgi:hypothetical protein